MFLTVCVMFQVQYLKNVNDGAVSKDLKGKPEFENLIDFTDSSILTKVPLPSAASNDKGKLLEITFSQKIGESRVGPKSRNFTSCVGTGFYVQRNYFK